MFNFKAFVRGMLIGAIMFAINFGTLVTVLKGLDIFEMDFTMPWLFAVMMLNSVIDYLIGRKTFFRNLW